jgi:endoglucanase
LAEETADLPGLGHTLLPGPVGFVVEAGQRWRLNPSYLPLQALRRLAAVAPAQTAAQWQSLLHSSQRVLIESAPRGFAPDWVLYAAGQGFVPDHQGEQQALGAYNAIRVYLWAGMLAPQDPAHAPLLQALAPMVERVAALGYPPETVDSVTGVVQGAGGGGFAAALLPLLQAAQATQALAAQQQYVADHPPPPDAYYGGCLMLWGQGWMQGRYRFAADGQLLVPWGERA